MDNIVKIQPERFYNLSNVSLNDIKLGDIVTGILSRYDASSKVAYVELGKTVGEIELFNFSASTFPNTIEAERNLFFKLNTAITAEVIDIFDDTVLLSRKNIQIKTIEKLTNSIGKNLTASVETIYPYGIFVDIGNGINSLLSSQECSSTKFYNLNNLTSIGKFIEVKLTNYDGNFFFVSRKEAQKSSYLTTGQTCWVTVGSPVDNATTGYFVEVTPDLPGIMDVPPGIILREGSLCRATFRKYTPKGAKLNFTF